MTKKASKKTTKKKEEVNGIWTKDYTELESVKGTRETVKLRDEKGNITGGVEYFGIKRKK